ncbi:MAG: hypothetical protein IJK27_04075 [Bacilli bacterium]|nr:hypothetical protein [Bacilli bacterium]
MKISSKISAIATMGALALVGTAFAAWQFNKNAEKVVNANVAITKDASVGEITLSQETFYLTLDQEFLGWTVSDHTNSEEAVTDGLTSFKVTYTGSEAAGDVSDVTLTAAFAADSAFDAYISVTGGGLGTPTASANVKEATYTLPTIAWVHKPTTKAQFDAMKSALDGAKVTFTYTATVA